MKKILLVCFDNLGDLVFTSALARALSDDPATNLSLLCKDYTAKIGYLLPGVQQVFAADPFWDKAPNRRQGKFANFFRCLSTVRSQHFDVAYIVGSHWQSALALRLIGIPKILGFKGSKNSFFLSRALPMPKRTEPVVAGILNAFKSELSHQVPPTSELNRGALPHCERPEVLRTKVLVVLHAFAGSAKRCAPLALWGDLARALGRFGYHILWTGMPSETQALRKAFPGEWDGTHFVDTWAVDLLQLAWIWSESLLFIGHDSGPLHVANALGVPVLGLYLPGEPLRTYPQGASPSIIIHKSVPQDLDVREVIEAAVTLLGRSPL